MKAADVLQGVAVGLEALAVAVTDPGERHGGNAAGAARGAAVVVRAVASMLVDRTPAECVAILEAIRDKGAQAIGATELDAQAAAVVGRVLDR